jgi:hypothetical protein
MNAVIYVTNGLRFYLVGCVESRVYLKFPI